MRRKAVFVDDPSLLPRDAARRVAWRRAPMGRAAHYRWRARALVALFISSAATAVLIAPVAIEATQALHVSPQGFAMTVAIACSTAFVTPLSAPRNMLFMEPGGCCFSDYVKVVLPVLLLTLLVTVALAGVRYPPG